MLNNWSFNFYGFYFTWIKGKFVGDSVFLGGCYSVIAEMSVLVSKVFFFLYIILFILLLFFYV
jgi:hypothetical protein